MNAPRKATGYCPPCAPAPCECPTDLSLACEDCGACEHESGPGLVSCWTCGATRCEDCCDAHGWPCEHYASRLD